MTVKTTEKQRQRFWERHQAGETYQEIADDYGLSKGCIRYWCRRQRDGGSCHSRWRRRKQGLLSSFHPLVRYVLLQLRLQQPRWGPRTLRYHMGQRLSLAGKRLPSETQIGRYLHQWPRFRRERKRKPSKRERPDPATRVHQRWQVDFKLGIELEDGTQVNLHTVRDHVGATCTAAAVLPSGLAGKPATRVTLKELQTTMRAGFNRWGTLPEEVQTDSEGLFVGRPDDPFPSLFTLWLVGLGIAHKVIRPGQPTDNAEVERCHRTLNDYAIVGNEHLSAPEVQERIEQAVEEMAFHLSSQAHGCHGRPPVEAHPELLQRPRPYQPHHELALFDLNRVDHYLADITLERKVNKVGQIAIGGNNKRYSVGRPFARSRVLVRFDPQDRHFVFYLKEASDKEIGRRPARDLEEANIIGLIPRDADVVPQQLPLRLQFEGVSC